MNVADVLIHLDEMLSSPQRAALEDSMRLMEGVIAPRFNPGKEHLLLVAFDPEMTSTAALLARVQSCGYRAQLIGP